MKLFSEKDVRRCYDLLQHDPDLGLTQLKAMDSGHIIGIGLFENEDDFAAECKRYNTLGDLFVGVNPRSRALLDQYGGLKNRMRSVFTDVTDSTKIVQITGVAVPKGESFSVRAKALLKEACILHDHETFFALGAPLLAEVAEQLKSWLLEPNSSWAYEPNQYMRVPGTALPNGGFFSRRVVFRRYRPYQLTEITDAILEATGSH